MLVGWLCVWFCDVPISKVESPSTNCVSNARSLAQVAAVFLGPSPLLSEAGRRAALELEVGAVVSLSLFSSPLVSAGRRL